MNDVNDFRLNRLIDGELSPAEYRAFLAALDDEPGGWRRCALALLESQALGQELSDLRGSLERPERIAAENVTAVKTAYLSPLSVLAIAASFLVMFGLGLVAPRLFSIGSKEGPFAGNFNTQPGTNENVVANDAKAARPDVIPKDIGNLRLVVDNGSGSETRQVPVYEVDRDPNDFLTSTSAPIGPEIIDLLREHGYDVQHQEEYLPADLEDGRQMIIPLDGYRITPVSRRY